MRKNLVVLLTLVAICSLQARRSESHQWEASWREELLFVSDQPFPTKALQVDEDRYVYFESGKGPWRRVDRGTVQIGPQGQLVFLSSSNGRKVAQLRGDRLTGDWGGLLLEKQTVPRLKPDPTWMKPGGVFSVGQIQVGMPHQQIQEIYPEEYTFCHDKAQFFYGNFREGQVAVRYDENDRVAQVSGHYLEQGGKPIFNNRTRRSDIERLFPEAGWRVVSKSELRMEIPGGRVSLGTGREIDEVQPGFYCVLTGNGRAQ